MTPTINSIRLLSTKKDCYSLYYTMQKCIKNAFHFLFQNKSLPMNFRGKQGMTRARIYGTKPKRQDEDTKKDNNNNNNNKKANDISNNEKKSTDEVHVKKTGVKEEDTQIVSPCTKTDDIVSCTKKNDSKSERQFRVLNPYVSVSDDTIQLKYMNRVWMDFRIHLDHHMKKHYVWI